MTTGLSLPTEAKTVNDAPHTIPLTRKLCVVAPLAVVQVGLYWLLNHFPLFASRRVAADTDRSRDAVLAVDDLGLFRPDCDGRWAAAAGDRRAGVSPVAGCLRNIDVYCLGVLPFHADALSPSAAAGGRFLAEHGVSLVVEIRLARMLLSIVARNRALAGLRRVAPGQGPRRMVAAVGSFAVLCCLSILTMKQHYVWDLLGGACVAALGWYASVFMEKLYETSPLCDAN